MGLLDDAIREHLELKRRHGADPDEVTRQEREALGAPVRGEFAQPDGEEGAGEAPAGVETETELDPVALDEDPAPAAIAASMAEPVDDPQEFEPQPPPQAPPGTEEDPWLVEDLADPDPEPERAAAPEAAPAEGAEGEDVLEETPEFLQETPEHERLWFEQKPPRDFDWDK